MIKRLIDYIKEIMHNEQLGKIFRYVFIGSLTTFISFGVFWLLAYPVNMNPNIANIISVICAVIFAYVTNKIFVFRSSCRTTKELIIEAFSFFSSRGITMLIEIGGVFVLTSLRMEAIISKMIISVLVLILNYLFSQFLVFRT
ncbi:GtrA family protein [Vallitalea sp.]|jgi:putative flippase GtrA|uniref:GtrA family protein n=1 Tax=Vallitalea sp. TaxID=1882829 RepID=UPI0025D80A2D|nr:GtrA family protein [Vallitalea sp.]MCT4686977.1 GtrA family protein [Vallitalea sp.]